MPLQQPRCRQPHQLTAPSAPGPDDVSCSCECGWITLGFKKGIAEAQSCNDSFNLGGVRHS
jgi:hypothetical protein